MGNACGTNDIVVEKYFEKNKHEEKINHTLIKLNSIKFKHGANSAIFNMSHDDKKINLVYQPCADISIHNLKVAIAVYFQIRLENFTPINIVYKGDFFHDFLTNKISLRLVFFKKGVHSLLKYLDDISREILRRRNVSET